MTAIERPGSLQSYIKGFVSFLKVVLPVAIFLGVVFVYLKNRTPATKGKAGKGKGRK